MAAVVKNVRSEEGYVASDRLVSAAGPLLATNPQTSTIAAASADLAHVTGGVELGAASAAFATGIFVSGTDDSFDGTVTPDQVSFVPVLGTNTATIQADSVAESVQGGARTLAVGISGTLPAGPSDTNAYAVFVANPVSGVRSYAGNVILTTNP